MGLEEIVVTANKRAESIRTAPIAITVVTGDQLAATGIQSTAELAAMVPGLTLENSPDGLEPHLRGVGTTAISAGEENLIATYVDGVYFANLSGSLQLNSISQLSLLGPGSYSIDARRYGRRVVVIPKKSDQDTS
jgi:iron complex outermembrane receptor protein